MVRKNWVIPQGGLPHRVYNLIRVWYTNYENGVALNPKRIPHPNFGDDVPITLTTRYRHELSFRYNELKWLSDILQLEDPTTTQAQLFSEALKRHKEMLDANRISGTVSHPQTFDLTKDEVGYIYELLSCLIMTRRQTPSERKLSQEQSSADIRGEW